MKLIIAIIHDEDNDRVSRMLTGENFRVTMIASTGGFLRSGRSTLLIGVEDERLERALQILRENCVIDKEGKEKKAIVFVLNVEEFIQA
ncbi:MAG TPA: cyclic-di-AMP receptor [Anaerolineaceae bacterium]|nr:cyclic-di-AMP receptor [Anaerolineaceae bacterium]HUM49159.1 cyclic-di-AMP receptor [Anaerolineaceae bacterium]